MQRSTSQMFPGFLEAPLQFIFVSSLSNKRYSYHLWQLIITNYGKKERKVISLTDCKPLPKNKNKNYISDIFWTFKSKLQIIHAASYIHCFFLTLINVFLYV